MARLPIEVIETIIDFLQNNRKALKWCCLASKSLITRTRSHLFKCVQFREPTDLQAWKEHFGDLENTPAIFTTHLVICCQSVEGEDFSSWIRSTFINVVALHVWPKVGERGVFAPFHNLLPHVKSLAVHLGRRESQEVSDFICSFPSLEDLCVFIKWSPVVTVGGCLSMPKLTGTNSLKLLPGEFTRQPLELSGYPRFREFVVDIAGDRGLSKELVQRCSGTLERVVIQLSRNVSIFGDSDIDFSNATKLREVKFELSTFPVRNFIKLLDTITRKRNKDFEKVSLRLPPVDHPLEKVLAALRAMGLERTLVGLMKRCENCLKFVLEVCPGKKGWTDEEEKEMFQDMFPEMMKWGIVAFETLQVHCND